MFCGLHISMSVPDEYELCSYIIHYTNDLTMLEDFSSSKNPFRLMLSYSTTFMT